MKLVKPPADLEAIREIVNAAASTSKWQPIATAPEDMRPVLVFVPGSRIGHCQEDVDAIYVAFLKHGGYCLLYDDHIIVEPTHWMPLPDPPK